VLKLKLVSWQEATTLCKYTEANSLKCKPIFEDFLLCGLLGMCRLGLSGGQEQP
jgi:hypothetical protein